MKPEATWWQTRLATGVSPASASVGPLFSSVSRMWNSSTTIPLGVSLNVVGTTPPDGEELYNLSGASLQLRSLANSPSSKSAAPRNFFPFSTNAQIFVADTSSEEGKLYRITNSGSPFPMGLIPPNDVDPSNASSFPDDFTEVAGVLFFTAHDGTDRRLFRTTNGQFNSATVVDGIFDPEQLVEFRGQLFLLARASSGENGEKSLFQLEDHMGVTLVSLFLGQPHISSALRSAAGCLFFVEPATGNRELLQCIRPNLTLITLGNFFRDSTGNGISQLVACDSRLYFTGHKVSQPDGPPVLCAAYDTDIDFMNPLPGIPPLRLLGTLGQSCIFWTDSGNGQSFNTWKWDAVSQTAPAMFHSGPAHDPPEMHRHATKPSGIGSNGLFYFTTRSGQVVETDGGTVQTIFTNGSLKVRPESLAALPGSLVFMASRNNYPSSAYSYSPVQGVERLWDAIDNSPPSPMVVLGDNAYFSAIRLNSATGSTELWRTDGTSIGTELVHPFILNRKAASIPMGNWRGHLVLAAAQGVIEPGLANHLPVIPPIPPLPKALRNEPYAFTYEQIVPGPASDEDGDPLSPYIFYKGEGTLTRNGVEVTFSSEIGPGDQFVWTPPEDLSGLRWPGTLTVLDDWGDGVRPVEIDITTPFQVWRESNFTWEEITEGSISNPGSDANGNGVPNAFEFVFGRDPKIPDPTPGWSPSIAIPDGGGDPVMRFSFTRVANLPEGTVLKVECSPNLSPESRDTIATKTENAAWETTTVVTEDTLPDGRVFVHLEVPDGAECLFLRLSVTL